MLLKFKLTLVKILALALEYTRIAAFCVYASTVSHILYFLLELFYIHRCSFIELQMHKMKSI